MKRTWISLEKWKGFKRFQDMVFQKEEIFIRCIDYKYIKANLRQELDNKIDLMSFKPLNMKIDFILIKFYPILILTGT